MMALASVLAREETQKFGIVFGQSLGEKRLGYGIHARGVSLEFTIGFTVDLTISKNIHLFDTFLMAIAFELGPKPSLENVESFALI
jgi:hypothetical protein